MVGIRPYDRRSSFLYTDDIVKIIDAQGNEAVFIIQRHESIAQHSVRFTNDAVGGGILPGTEIFADFRFLQPARENRLFEIRPFIFAVNRAVQAPPPAINVIPGSIVSHQTPLVPPIASPDLRFIPAGVELKWRSPAGVARDGTDLSFDVPVSIPPATVFNPLVGGVNGGFIQAILVPYVDDFSDLWKLYSIYGNTIEFGIANRTQLFGVGQILGGSIAPANKDYFIGIVGRKYLLGPVSDEIKKKVENEDIDYESITVGGIPTVTTRA